MSLKKILFTIVATGLISGVTAHARLNWEEISKDSIKAEETPGHWVTYTKSSKACPVKSGKRQWETHRHLHEQPEHYAHHHKRMVSQQFNDKNEPVPGVLNVKENGECFVYEASALQKIRELEEIIQEALEPE